MSAPETLNMRIKQPCACGCGVIVRGKYVRAHRPLLSYRFKKRRRTYAIRAEKALGKPLPKGSVVHHADGSKNEHAPLVICQDHAYHMLLHRRMRIVARGGNPDTESFCSACGTVKPNEQFTRDCRQKNGRHSKCLSCGVIAKQRKKAMLAQSGQSTGSAGSASL